MTQNNLAIAYKNRLAGERKENIEAAIRHYEAALQVCTREAAPHDWATTQNNLAAAYSDRLAGSARRTLRRPSGTTRRLCRSTPARPMQKHAMTSEGWPRL
jgi:uncharacterized protein